MPVTSRSTALGVTAVALLVAISVVACAPSPPPPPRDPALCGASATAAAASHSELNADEAARALASEIEATAYREPDGDIPVVTVEKHGDRLAIQTTSADNESDAIGIARDVARDGNLIGVEVDKPVRASVTNDPGYSDLWSLQKTNFESAWTINDGTGATVAVVDTGVQANHPDLSGQVDPGREFLGGVEGPFNGDDPAGHGTHVAGTIAAIANNNIGVVGMAPGARILPVRVLDDQGDGYSSDVSMGIIWAVDNGADVVNLSLGGPDASVAVLDAVDYAVDRGVVVVAAAGNDGHKADPDPISYPAAYNRTIAVAALYEKTNGGLARASYSTANCYVDVAAPGTAIWSTYPIATYARGSGTSMATPHVSAAAALIKAEHPACSPVNAAKAIRSSANDILPKGRDKNTGFGKINPRRALDKATTLC